MSRRAKTGPLFCHIWMRYKRFSVKVNYNICFIEYRVNTVHPNVQRILQFVSSHLNNYVKIITMEVIPDTT